MMYHSICFKFSSCLVTVVCLFEYFDTVCGSSDMRDLIFRKDYNYIIGTLGIDIRVQKRSRIECATLCLQKDDCATFSYNKSEAACQLRRSGMDNSKGNVFGKKEYCPSTLGYARYAYGNRIFCLKFYKTKSTFSNAKVECSNTGGHLLLIEDEEMYLFVKQDVDHHIGGDAWIDGEDITGDRNYKTWRGDDVTYFKWWTGNPDGFGHTCILLFWSGDFHYEDHDCTSELGFVCQI